MKHPKEMNLGELIDYALCHGICTSFKYAKGCPITNRIYGGYVLVDKFVMHANNHDTGISVTVYIVSNNVDPYLMIQGTYWKVPGYDHNKFKHKHGKWDKAFDEAVMELRNASGKHCEEKLEEENKRTVSKKEHEKRHKNQIESLF